MLHMKGMVIGKLPPVKLSPPPSPLLLEDFPQQIFCRVSVCVWVRVQVGNNLFGGEGKIFLWKIFQVPKGICFIIYQIIYTFPAEYFSFIKYSLKNVRLSFIYQTELIELNRNFEPNLQSFFITQSLVASCMSTDFVK